MLIPVHKFEYHLRKYPNASAFSKYALVDITSKVVYVNPDSIVEAEIINHHAYLDTLYNVDEDFLKENTIQVVTRLSIFNGTKVKTITVSETPQEIIRLMR